MYRSGLNCYQWALNERWFVRLVTKTEISKGWLKLIQIGDWNTWRMRLSSSLLLFDESTKVCRTLSVLAQTKYLWIVWFTEFDLYVNNEFPVQAAGCCWKPIFFEIVGFLIGHSSRGQKWILQPKISTHYKF